MIQKLFQSIQNKRISIKYGYLIFIYFFVHLLIRLCFTNTLETDEAEQAFLSQQFQLGYNQQPPLYTWVIILLVKLLGYQLLSIILLRILLLLGIFYLVYELTRRLTHGNRSLAITSSLSLLLFFQLSIESLRQTHTVLVTFAVAYLIFSFFALTQYKSIKNYFLFGIAIALGALSKYNFVIPVLSLFIITGWIKEYRQIIFSRKIMISLGIAVLLILPHLFWLYQNGDATREETIQDLATLQTNSYVDTAIPSIWALCKGVISFGGIYIVCMLLFFKFNFHAVLKTNSNPFINFLGKFLLCSIIILGGILIITKATNAHERWIQPLLFLISVYLFGKEEIFTQPNFKLQTLKKFLIVLAFGLQVYVFVGIVFGPSLGFVERINRPYDLFCNYLLNQKKDILDTLDYVICDEIDLAGNLKFQLPNYTVEVITPEYPTFFSSTNLKNSKSLLLITTKEDNHTLIKELQQLVYPKKVVIEKSYQKTIPFTYSKEQYYTLYVCEVKL